MKNNSYRVHEEHVPAIRNGEKADDSRRLRDFRCPFCGAESLLNSDHDVQQDPLRVQLYCNNPSCDVRELDVVAMRAGGVEAGRADIETLHEIDAGPSEERPQSQIVSAGSIIGSTDRVYSYRTRPITVDIKPR